MATRYPKSTVPDFPSALFKVARGYMDSHLTRGFLWPDEAEFCVEYNLSTWPCGYMHDTFIEFFDSQAELDLWLAKKVEWAKYEDNYVARRVWRWDLGPQHMPEHDLNEGELYRPACLST